MPLPSAHAAPRHLRPAAHFFVLRPAGRRGHEQTSRGRAYRDVIQMYAALVRKHHLDHTSRGEWYEADPYVNQAEAG